MKRKALSTYLTLALALTFPLPLLAVPHSDFGCDGCHTPHHSEALAGVPLWNGETSELTFTMYSSASFDAGALGKAAAQPTGSAKLCLSCHDGSHPFVAGETDFGSDLSKHHPISFVYDSAVAAADGALKDPSEDSTLGGSIQDDLLAEDGSLNCTSCHDIHTTGIGEHMLRGYDYGPGAPQLCRMCHNK